MKFVPFCCILVRWDFLMRFHAFWPLWDVLVRFYALCCTFFIRDILMRFHALSGRYELCVWDLVLVWPLCDFLMRFRAFGCRVFFWWCDVRTVERWMMKDAGDWVYTTVYWTLRGFVCASWVVRWWDMKVSWVVVGESVSALGDRRNCVEVVWFVLPACITSSRYVCLRMT
jgi:hypothetical protein